MTYHKDIFYFTGRNGLPQYCSGRGWMSLLIGFWMLRRFLPVWLADARHFITPESWRVPKWYWLYCTYVFYSAPGVVFKCKTLFLWFVKANNVKAERPSSVSTWLEQNEKDVIASDCFTLKRVNLTIKNLNMTYMVIWYRGMLKAGLLLSLKSVWDLFTSCLYPA